MDVKNTFNIILLSLSLTTLLITIISYIIFRLRYSLQKKNDQELHHLEGTFFRRFAPQLKKLNDEYKDKLKQKINKREFWRSRPVYLFLLIGVVIAVIFSTEGYFLYNKELKKRQDISTNYRKLLSMGLLKVNNFDPEYMISDTEFIGPEFKKRQAILFGLINKLQVGIFSPANVQSSQPHLDSLQKWVRWFESHEIPHTIVNDCESLLTHDLTLFPNSGGTSEMDECARRVSQDLKGAIFTGHQVPKSVFEKLKIEMRHEENSKKTGTVLFRSHYILGETPAGLLLDWQPDDRSYHFKASQNNTLAFYYKGDSLALGNNLESLVVASERVIWMAMDPLIGIEGGYYMDHILASLMAYAAKRPFTKVASWPNGDEIVTAIAVDSEDKLENLPKLVKKIKSYGYPITAFLVSDLVINDSKVLEGFNDADEMASHTNDHRPLGERTMDYDFERLQNSRIDLEEIYKKEVVGFRPPEEFYDLSSQNAVIQSGFKYMFSDQKNFRSTPYMIHNGDFVMIPRILEDDYLMKRNRLLATPDQFYKNFLTQYQFVRTLGGAHLLSLHTNFLGEDQVMLEGLNLFLKEIGSHPSQSKLTYAELADWWQRKDKLVSWIENKSTNKYILHVTNNSSRSVDSVVIEFPDLKEEQTFKLIKVDIPKLSPNQHYTLELYVHDPNLKATS